MELKKYSLENISFDFSYGTMPNEKDFCENGYPIFSGYRVVGYSKKYNTSKRSLVVVARGVGGTGNVEIAEEKTFLTNLSIAILINENIADIDFLKNYLNIQGLRYLDSGAAQSQITIQNLRHHKIFIPSLDIQKRIASILSAYDNLIEVNNKRIKVLEQMAENLYKEWFVRFRFPGHENAMFENGIPKGWKEKRLEQFGISLDSGSRPSGGVDDSLEEGMPSLGAEAVNGLGEFNYSNVKLIPFTYYNQMKRGKHTGRDILIYKDGAYIGKTTIFMNGFPYTDFAVNEHVFLLNAVEKDYQFYLYFTLHLPEYFALMQNLNRNAAQPGLSKLDINRIKILVPKKETVKMFNKAVEPILGNVFSLALQIQNLTRQRDLLLPRLMSGKLEVK